MHNTVLAKVDLEKLSAVDERGRGRPWQHGAGDAGRAKGAVERGGEGPDQAALLDEVFGLGPLEALLRDPSVSDILVNRPDMVYVERRGILEKTISGSGMTVT